MTDYRTDLSSLLGQRIDDAGVAKYLKNVDPNTKLSLSRTKDPRFISKAGGLVVYAEKKMSRITDLFFYSEGHEGYSQYAGPLPHGITFAMPRAEVKKRVGKKEAFEYPDQDTWDQDDVRLIVEYLANNTPKIVSLSRP